MNSYHKNARRLRRALATLPLIVLATFTGCTSTHVGSKTVDSIVVDISERRIVAKGDGKVMLSCPCETSSRGVGKTRNSGKTPLGDFTIARKEAGHRFGPVMRLSGYQGFSRGILFHKNLDGKPNGTRGCVCPIRDDDYLKLWKLTQVGARVRIVM